MLGKHQLGLLLALGTPGTLLPVPDRVARSLAKRGLLSEYRGCLRITPAGMRALADAFEAGQLEQFMRPRTRTA